LLGQLRRSTLTLHCPFKGTPPSRADELLTRQLKEALSMVDVKVLDHFIVAGRATLSFAERGLL
jgi:DNA repair protein RadC